MLKTLSFSLLLLAHSWYPIECCDNQDCEPVKCEDLEELKTGEIKYADFTFRRDQIKPSQDKKCHTCVSKAGTPWCVFIQIGT